MESNSNYLLSERFKRAALRKSERKVPSTVEPTAPRSQPIIEPPSESPAKAAEVEPPALEARYEPFQSATPTFSKTKLTKKQWDSLTQVQRAKYLAYEKPSTRILTNIAHSEMRVDELFKEDKKKMSEQAQEFKSRTARANDQGDGAQMAQMRMVAKAREERESRNAELQQLIEGQRSSFDAIRLKEYLILTKPNTSCQVPLSEKERRRVEILLSS
ncbi:hypothetical protein SmJEL517_g04683 [Synchytrium microbalum]|uniref:Uncharacterized protein n=1 Tax=Synchytrium microbalum TaxID=1806994 RepID=A0A507BYB5_9FUNG|nr:uncharacterized protein SmJEL517_g04683 [Synchytrium microbalum]TPX32118.1 hypothetical protein SmJEL517_g04683 [Synchytrium microbalum]